MFRIEQQITIDASAETKFQPGKKKGETARKLIERVKRVGIKQVEQRKTGGPCTGKSFRGYPCGWTNRVQAENFGGKGGEDITRAHANLDSNIKYKKMLNELRWEKGSKETLDERLCKE